jgi:polyisoprenoid-binding protein YceI
MVSKVRGKFETFSGTVTVAPDGTPSVTAEIDVASLNTGNEQRDGHVKSADFFDVERYPAATFTSTSVRPNGEAYVLDGYLTLKGVTKPVSLDLEFNGVSPGQGYGEVSGYEASVVLSRRDFGIDIDLPMETGGAVVGDKVTITLAIEPSSRCDAPTERRAGFSSSSLPGVSVRRHSTAHAGATSARRGSWSLISARVGRGGDRPSDRIGAAFQYTSTGPCLSRCW